LNNHIGGPLTLLKLKKEHQIAIIEMGANHPNDIQELCEIAEPNYGIISNIGKAHLLGFKNIDGVIQTKTALYRAVQQNNGLLFVNSDDEILCKNLPTSVKYLFYSAAEKQDLYITGKLVKLTPFIHLKWKNQDYESPELETQIIGEYNFYNLLAAITIATHFKVDPEKINTAIRDYRNENNRSQLVKTAKNELIMDAYNANPSSMKSAINSFNKIEHSNKLMILGDMFELGDETFEEHKNIVKLAQDTHIKTFFVGNYFATHAQQENNFFKDKETLRTYLNEHSIANYLILLKGSRGIALESLVDLL
ncbi:MAG TPA: UDP-N-acetylmuramoyl-tripeptide--D-alanyl-D-alanine ligase, partial [Crocinitomicaceae bacterium]|nr:UDP-N-acetylmuramoyl-tripeptide--D-alanyl-D-alanine ligase [Crocinitomicaceae bacterium]